MCIRDRNKDICSALLGPNGDIAFIHRIENLISTHSLNAVSYTHLDVYKRQAKDYTKIVQDSHSGLFFKYDYSNSTKPNQLCLEIILCRILGAFDYLMYPYYPTHMG